MLTKVSLGGAILVLLLSVFGAFGWGQGTPPGLSSKQEVFESFSALPHHYITAILTRAYFVTHEKIISKEDKQLWLFHNFLFRFLIRGNPGYVTMLLFFFFLHQLFYFGSNSHCCNSEGCFTYLMWCDQNHAHSFFSEALFLFWSAQKEKETRH